MKKLFALAMLGAASAGVAVYASQPDEFARAMVVAGQFAERAWTSIEANPVPVLVALGTFLVTIVYHKLKGRSLRESLAYAATRVQLVSVPAPQPETPVVVRAKARATRAQLIADQISLENRIRKLPAEVRQAEKDACYTEQAVVDGERALLAKRKAHEDAVTKLELLREELAAGEEELAAIAEELKKLADVV
jgi:hypothetical protein